MVVRTRRTVTGKKSQTVAPAGKFSLEDFLPYRLVAATDKVRQVIAHAYHARHGRTDPEWRLITILSQGPRTQTEIVKYMMMDKVTVSRAAHTLVSRGLAERAAHDVDGRSHRLMLTTKGRGFFDEVAVLVKEYETQLLAEFSPRELESLKRLLIRLEQRAAAILGRLKPAK